jgi:hypothetical protein
VRRVRAIALATALCGCATARSRPAADLGIAECAAGASGALLSVEALQCWLPAPHGRWRTLSHDSHFDVLVVRAEAADLRDAADIGRAFAANQGGMFSEILVYVTGPGHGDRGRTRRIRWTRAGGIETFDFTGPG